MIFLQFPIIMEVYLVDIIQRLPLIGRKNSGINLMILTFPGLKQRVLLQMRLIYYFIKEDL